MSNLSQLTRPRARIDDGDGGGGGRSAVLPERYGRRCDLAAAGVVLLTAGTLLAPPRLLAQEEHDHDHEHSEQERSTAVDHHQGLHFTHPLFAESVSPDRKIRLDYNHFDLPGDGIRENSARLGFEYALSRNVSVEASLPYSFTEGTAGLTHLSLKFANFALEDDGILLGYGIGAALPTSGDAPGEGGHGDEHAHHVPGGNTPEAPAATSSGRAPPGPALDGGGTVVTTLGRDHWEMSPFFDIGLKTGRWEVVALGSLGIPTGTVAEGEEGVTISYNTSLLYHAGARLDLLAELRGSGGIQGHPVGEDVVNLAPGIRWRVLPDQPLVLGLGASFPVTDATAYDGRVLGSLFYHFGG